MPILEHGVYTTETATELLPIVETDTAIPVVVGTAPVNTAQSPKVNEPVMAMSYDEALAALGFEAAVPVSEGSEIKRFRYTLSEVMYSAFQLYGHGPVIFVNVLDPEKHRTAITTQSITPDADGIAVIRERGIIASSLTITGDDGDFVLGEDYTLLFDDDGYLTVTSVIGEDGQPKLGTATLTVTGYKLDPDAVTAADVIGGIDAAGKRRGLECVTDIYTKFRLIPTVIAAPGYSSDPEVAAIMATKSLNINTVFNAVCLIDAPADADHAVYSDVPAWKTEANIFDINQYLCWPMVQMSGTVYHMSTHVMGVLARTDAEQGRGTPVESPSNKQMEITGTCLEDGTEVTLSKDDADYLNGEGITCAINFIGGWRLWGNRTACYPDNTDIKDNFLCVRRTFYWIRNTLITNMWQHVDRPGNRTLIDTIVNSCQTWLNSLVAQRSLLAATVTFPEESNPTTDLMDGKYFFKLEITPCTPAEKLTFDLSIDTDGYSNLFA